MQVILVDSPDNYHAVMAALRSDNCGTLATLDLYGVHFFDHQSFYCQQGRALTRDFCNGSFSLFNL